LPVTIAPPVSGEFKGVVRFGTFFWNVIDAN